MTRARRSIRARGSALVLPIGLLFTAACGDGDPQAAPTSPPESSSAVETSSPTETSSPVETSTSASPTASATPTIDKPTLPPEAEVQDHTGATAFVRYWWDEYNYALGTGDPAGLAAISSDECVFCASLAEQIEERAEQLHRTEGGTVTVIDAAAPPDDVTTVYRVGSALSQDAGRIIDASGQTAGTIDAFARGRGDALVFYDDDTWLMDGMNIEVLD